MTDKPKVLTQLGKAFAIQGDARCLPLPDESVDLIVTSPPYFALRSYQDAGEHYEGQIGSEETPQDFLEALWACTEEWVRVLKPSGSIWVNLGDKYAGSGGHNNANVSRRGTMPLQGGTKTLVKNDALVNQQRAPRRNAPAHYNQNSNGVPSKSLMGLPWRYAIGCIDRGLLLRAEVVWSKPNNLPDPAPDRVSRTHEQFFHFTKEARYFSAVDEIREPHTGHNGSDARENQSSHNGVSHRVLARDPSKFDPRGRRPGSVWSIASEPIRIPEDVRARYDLPDHFAAFPTEWPRRIILGWSPEDGVVLDPFGGTGTTAMVAKALGRVGISVDLSHDYTRLARWRIDHSRHETKALKRTWAERQEALL